MKPKVTDDLMIHIIISARLSSADIRQTEILNPIAIDHK
jgi:hypothetical protein